MKEPNLPTAISEGVLEICGVKLRAYQLDSGERVIDAYDMQAFFDALENGAFLSEAEANALGIFIAFGRLPKSEAEG